MIKAVLLAGRSAQPLALKLRVPAWAEQDGLEVRVAGEAWKECSGPGLIAHPQPATFCTIQHTFGTGGLLFQ